MLLAEPSAVSSGLSEGDKPVPYEAPVLANFVLTGPDSSNEKRHIEFGLCGSGLIYSPGDALAVVPRNDRHTVDAVLACLGVGEHSRLQIAGEDMYFCAALATQFEITVATPRFLNHWARVSESADLRALAAPENAEARRRYLHDNHIEDIVRRYPVAGLNAAAVVPGLRQLRPRLYSIASSPTVNPNLAAIVTATLSYRLHGQVRRGVVTGYQMPRARPGSTLPIFVQPDPNFRLPVDGDIIMVAAGTGIAPFRAFVAERRARRTRGRSWLFFGNRTRRNDFLYQHEWQEALEDGSLTRMDLAFSRDLDRKTYVQHRLLEHGATLYAWLESGASVYVCGDAANMAPAVHATLLDIIQNHGTKSRAEAIDYVRRMARDQRYCRSIY